MTCKSLKTPADLAKVMRELLFVFNDMSKAPLESKVYSKVWQTPRNLGGQ